ncbi:MAG: ribosome maturation factor RimP [Candidatus Omnitrophica bacterium]|nr:ribosome maturation factor RimP [Candidatus Omnitrophota bacterium]
MDNQVLAAQLKGLLEGYLQSRNLELIDLILRNEGNGLVLRVLADRPEGGINLDECGALNREIGALLDEKNLIESSYILEVSSPGLDRPLRTKKDFSRATGKKVKFFLNDLVDGKLEWGGIITGVNNESVFINSGISALEIPLARIVKAKLLF